MTSFTGGSAFLAFTHIRGSFALSSTTINYVYDPLYRLTAANYSTGQVYTYTYDAVGNQASAGAPTGPSVYTYDAANRLATINGTTTYVWDNNGNLLNNGAGITYTYDTENRLLALNASLDIYSYDGLGDRIRQVAPGGTISYTLDQAGGLTQVLAEITGTQTSTYVYGLTRTSQQTSAGTQYFLDDGLGSVRELVDASGNLTLVKRYDPYGQTISSSGSGGSNYGFAGEYKDPSALIFLRSRYYTSRGRFIQKDSIPGSYIKLADGGASYDGSGTSQANTGDWYVHYTRPQTLNGWSYANGNPTNHTDPSGHFVPFCMFGYYFDKQTNTCKPTAIAGLLNSFLPPGSATIAFESSSAPGPGEIIGPLVLGGVCVFAIGALIHTVIQTQFQSVTVLQAQTRQTSTGETVRVRELSDSEVRQRGLHREKDAQGYGATDKVYEDENGNTWIGNDQGELQPFP